MHFLNSRYSQQTTLDAMDSVKLLKDPVGDSISKENPQNASEISPIAQISQPNLMSKFYRFQTITDREPPETFYENEAWAPKVESIRFFHKHELNVE